MSKDLEAVVQYLNQPETDYAYMIDGPWGSGKTYFWKHMVVPALTPNEGESSNWTLVYLSLHAIKTSDEIRKAVIAQLHPVLGRTGPWLGALAPTVLEYLPLGTPLKAGAGKFL